MSGTLTHRYTTESGPSLSASMAIAVLDQIPGVVPAGFNAQAGEAGYLYTLDQLANFFQIEGDIVFNRVTVTNALSPYSVTDTDYAMSVTTAGGAVTVTLPASPSNGRMLNIKKISSDSTVVTIGRNGKTINGAAANFTFSVNGTSVTLMYDSTTGDWEIV